MDNNVANTILEQLGGRRFIVMTGARGFVGGRVELQFGLPRNDSGANKVRIVLEPSDTYTVQFYKIARRGLDARLLAEVSDVYADNLRRVFERYTGLATSL